jgi:hypothetical protein
MRRATEVSKDKHDVIGPILSEIGRALGRIVGGNPDGTFLYAEGGEGWMASGVFKAENGSVCYFRPSRELGDLLLEAWNAEEADKRWAVMEYAINGTQFDVSFQFPDQIDPKESEFERRPRALKRRFGDKPIVYPPWPPPRDAALPAESNE